MPALAPYGDAISEAENWLDGTKVETEAQMQAVDAILKEIRSASTAVAAPTRVFPGARWEEATPESQGVGSAKVKDAAELHTTLSDREYQIFLMLVQGRGVVEIGEELHLSAKTVSTHKARLMKKLGVNNLSDLVRYALSRELA